jgi:hypothetical protein
MKVFATPSSDFGTKCEECYQARVWIRSDAMKLALELIFSRARPDGLVFDALPRKLTLWRCCQAHVISKAFSPCRKSPHLLWQFEFVFGRYQALAQPCCFPCREAVFRPAQAGRIARVEAYVGQRIEQSPRRASVILQNGMAALVGPDPIPYPRLLPSWFASPSVSRGLRAQRALADPLRLGG